VKWVNLAVTAVTLALLVWYVGAGPFLDGLRAVNGEALAAAAALAVLTTACCAWRWRIVARGHGVDLPLGTAVAAYYRSIFLNVTLPGGVLGDVHRGMNHGLRPVVWERVAGQVVQIVLTVAVLAAGVVALALVAVALVVVIVKRWASIALASALVVAGHTATFLIAARTAGVTVPLSELLPLALLVLAGAALPNVGGWGPREGVAAWAFGAAGIGASLGVATGVVYGVMVFFASLPGAVVLLVTAVPRREAAPHG
jgi:hypothetical protein